MPLTLRTGTRVRFSEDNLGLIGRAETISSGDIGTVLGPAPYPGWWFVEPDLYPKSVCPVVAGMVEPL